MNEELQSTNEELQTVNEELRVRTDEVNHVNAFLQAVVGS
jgi:two-component system, chemotaxis family, CheB/CheR fusion protein